MKHKPRPSPLRFAVLASICIAAFALCSGVRATDWSAEYAKTVAAMRQNVSASLQTWPKAAPKLPDRPALPRLLVCRAPKAVAGRDLFLQLIDDGKGAIGIAFVPGWNAAIHPVSSTRFSRRGNELSGALRLVMTSDGRRPPKGEEFEIEFGFGFTLRGTAITGAVSTKGVRNAWPKIPAARSKVTGCCVVPGTAVPVADVPRPALTKASAFDQYAAGRWYQLFADRVYALARHTRIALGASRSAADVWRADPFLFSDYRPLLFGSDPKPRKKQKKRRKPKIVKAEDAIDLLESLDDEEPEKQGKSEGLLDKVAAEAGSSRLDAKRGAEFRSILAYMRYETRRSRELLQLLAKQPAALTAAPPASPKIEDPAFGPWYGDRPLPLTAAGEARLPAHAAGVQDWPYFGSWWVAGSVPLATGNIGSSWLPEVLGPRDATLTTVAPPDRRGKHAGPVHVAWKAMNARNATGLVRLKTGGVVYGTTSFQSETDGERWFALGATGHARCWVNDRAAAGLENGSGDEKMAIFKAVVRKGDNRITLRCNLAHSGKWFWLRTCTRGAPADAAAAKQRVDAVRAARTRIDARRAKSWGFRRDGTASYPDATPPTAWDIEKGINVLWRAKLSTYSKSSPLVVGDRVFTCMDPHFLICFDEMTGKELWRREANVLEKTAPDQLEANRRLYRAYRELASAPAVPSDDKERRRRLGRSYGSWRGHLFRHGKCQKSSNWDGTNGGPWVGYSFATPVSDGKWVWVKYGTGATACFNLEGKCLWLAHTRYTGGGDTAFVSSPVLTGETEKGTGRLILQAVRGKRGGLADTDRLIAYEAATGKVAWTVHASVPGGSPSPLVMTLTDGKEEMEVVVTNGGTVVRALDGKVLRKGIVGSAGNGTGTVGGDVIYRHGAKYRIGNASQLIMLDRDHVGARRIWTIYGAPCAGGWAWRDGLLYALHGSQFGGPYHILDPLTGHPFPRTANAGVRGVGAWHPEVQDCYVPTMATRDHVYLAHRGNRGNEHGRKYHWSWFTVTQNGLEGRYVAHNKIETTLSGHPVADGDRLYLRNDGFLTCFGYTGEKGKAYELDVNVRTLMTDLDLLVPEARKPIRVPARPPVRHRLRALRMDPVTHPRSWTFLGPFPDADVPTLAKAVPDPALGLTAGKSLEIAGRELEARVFSKKSGPHYSAVRDRRPAIDMRPHSPQDKPSAWLASTTVATDRTGVWRVIQPDPSTVVWIGGKKVAHGDRVVLKRGISVVLACFGVDPKAKASAFLLQFLPSDDQMAELALYRRAIARSRAKLEAFAKAKPADPLTKRIKSLLAKVGGSGKK